MVRAEGKSRAMPGRLGLLALAVILGLSSGQPSRAQAEQAEQNGKLEELERSAAENKAKAEDLEKKADALKTQILALRDEVIAAARQAQDFEDNLSSIEQTLARLETQEQSLTLALGNRRSQLTDTLGALQRIALQPPEALLAAPGSPIDTVRSAMLLGVAVPAIEEQAQDLKHKLVQLTALRQEIGRERADLSGAAESLVDQRGLLSSLIERKRSLYEATTAEQASAQAAAEQAAREAADLRDLLAKLEEESRRRGEEATEMARMAAQERQEEAARLAREEAAQVEEQAARAKQAAEEATEEAAEQAAAQQVARLPIEPLSKPDNVRPFPKGPRNAALLMPARGQIVTVYGQKETKGSVSKGITISTRESAQVVAPYDGRVAYAGVFRRYGQILIIEHGGRYHTLLAGVDRIDAVVGQWVLAGEPIGVMANQTDGNPELYLELRRGGQPINPLPWLANMNDKVQG